MKFLRNDPVLIRIGLTIRMNNLLKKSIRTGTWNEINLRIALLRLWRMEQGRICESK